MSKELYRSKEYHDGRYEIYEWSDGAISVRPVLSGGLGLDSIYNSDDFEDNFEPVPPNPLRVLVQDWGRLGKKIIKKGGDTLMLDMAVKLESVLDQMEEEEDE